MLETESRRRLTFKKITGIMACDPRGVIGKEGKLPWVYPEELRHFRQTTDSHVTIMGHKTFKAVPDSFLKNRFHIVFSTAYQPSQRIPNVIFVSSLNQFFQLPPLPENKKYFMIGGAIVAELFLKQNLIHEFLLTEIKENYEGDTFLSLDSFQKWPYAVVQETLDFIIKRYTNPSLLI